MQMSVKICTTTVPPTTSRQNLTASLRRIPSQEHPQIQRVGSSYASSI